MNDPSVYSDLAAVVIVLGGILLTMGLRWWMLKRTNIKFLVPVMICAIAEIVIGGLLVAVG